MRNRRKATGRQGFEVETLASTSVQLVRKSLRLDRLKLALIGSISLIIAVNATLLLPLLAGKGAMILTLLVFGSVFLPTFFILLEVLSYSSQSISLFRTLGANAYPVMIALLLPLAGIGLVGAMTGTTIGLLLSNASAGLSPVSLEIGSVNSIDFLPSVLFVLVSCVCGVAAAVVLGVRLSWGKSR